MKKNKFILSSLISTLALLPTLVFATAPGVLFDSGSTFSNVVTNAKGILNSLIPLLIGAAVVVFLYGVMLFIAKASAGNADGRAEGIRFMIFGIIGIAVMVSVWGLVGFVTNTFGTTGGVPQFNTGGTSRINGVDPLDDPAAQSENDIPQF